MGRRLRSLPGQLVIMMVALTTLIAGCVLGGGTEPASLRFVVPTPPGGGFDQTARLTAIGLEQEKLAEQASVINIPGDGGLAAIHRVRLAEGDASMLLQAGLATISNIVVAGQEGLLKELTPIAQLVEEPGAILVRRDSEYRTIDELAGALRNSPEALGIGGGSQPGGPDYLAAMLFLDAIGMDTAQIKYRSYEGGGDMLGALVSGEVDVAFTGVAEHLYEIRAGEVHILAVTGAERLPGLAAPTLRERGYDVEFHNWRGLMAPRISETQRAALVDMFAALNGADYWNALVSETMWTGDFIAGAEFEERIAAELVRIQELLARFPATVE